MNNIQFIIIGVGSVGKRHAQFINTQGSDLLCVDISKNARDWCKNNLNIKTKSFSKVSSLSNHIKDSKKKKIGIISNLGPDHFKSIEELYSLGVNNFLIEKPITNSLKSLHKLENLCNSNKLNIVGGFQNRYLGIVEKIIYIGKNELGGDPMLMCVNGGAMGIVTTGIHFLDLAISIFGSNPINTLSNLRSIKINPRAKKLDFWEGCSIWEFEKKKRLSINSTNFSSVKQRAEIFFPWGRILINGDMTLSIYKRNMKEVSADKRIIRLGVDEKLKRTIMPNRSNLYKKMFKNLIDNKNNNFKRELIASKAIIFSLISNVKSKTMSLDEKVEKKYYDFEWQIS